APGRTTPRSFWSFRYMTTFSDLGVPAVLTKALADLGITTPFPIQAATLPDSLAGRDVLGRGRTGSGKTYAFALPVLARLAASHLNRRPPPVFGGVGANPQITGLRNGVDVLVACPGRLLDHMQNGHVSLDAVE